MLKLLRSELKALFKWRASTYTIAVMIFIGLFSVFINTSSDAPTLDGFFAFPYITMMICSVISGLFLYRDYSQNTIRNKISVGHSRSSVYFSKTITVFIFMLLNIALSSAMTLIAGSIFGDLEYIDWGIFVQNILMTFANLCVAVTLVSLFAINIQSPVGSMLPMMLMFAVMFVGMITMELLMINENTEMIELFKTLPIMSQQFLLETEKPVNLHGTLIISGLIVAIGQYLSFSIFRKLDLK